MGVEVKVVDSESIRNQWGIEAELSPNATSHHFFRTISVLWM